MSYSQLRSPKLDTSGTVGYCLAFAEVVFSTPRLYPYATAAWNTTQFKHYDSNFPMDVSVPVWFSYTVNGVNLGHVVIHVPGRGYLSSPYKQGTTQAWLNSLEDVERIYGVHFVGWSEDLAGVRLVEPVAPSQSTQPLAQYVGKTVTLSGSVETWRVYPVGSVSPRNPVATLKPMKFGGISYTIESVDTSPNSVVVSTRDFGKVSLPIAQDNFGHLYPTATIN